MAETRLAQIQRKRKLIEEELELRRQLAALDEEEASLLPQRPSITSSDQDGHEITFTASSPALPIAAGSSDAPVPQSQRQTEQSANAPNENRKTLSRPEKRETVIRPPKRKTSSRAASDPNEPPFKSFAAYATVVKAAGGQGYVELRCYLCGANCRLDDYYLQGVPGFRAHLTLKHPGHPEHGEALTDVSVLKKCTYRRLTEQDIEAANRGQLNVYSIPKIFVEPKPLVNANELRNGRFA